MFVIEKVWKLVGETYRRNFGQTFFRILQNPLATGKDLCCFYGMVKGITFLETLLRMTYGNTDCSRIENR